jgi:L-lactate dehydrogenase complex protein LldG
MSSRERILKAVLQNKPELVEMPVINIPDAYTDFDLTEKYMQSLEFIGGRVKRVQSLDAVKADVANELSQNNYIVNTIPELGSVNTEINQESTSVELEKIYISCIQSQLGVAENGAVWIDDTNLPNRLLPFICQHLLVILDSKNIVANMHEAYSRLNTFRTGYGLFLAGPSKTADIEQSLVIGAHGARSLTVYLVG